MNHLRTYLLWTPYSVTSLLLCIWLAWHLSASANFLYPLWYSALNIDQTITASAPRNVVKKQFINTTTQEHYRLFGEIVKAVQNRGNGLAQIRYYDSDGKLVDTLLTQNEIIHLKDVAYFVSSLNWSSLILLVLSLLFLALMFLLRVGMPLLRKLFMSVGAVIVFVAVIIIIIGPTKLFYWLHTVIFPGDHQWFFYYEESLMSMMMKAPALFAPLGMQLVMLGFLIWILHLLLLKKISVFKLV